jgi:hypothetical protein
MDTLLVVSGSALSGLAYGSSARDRAQNTGSDTIGSLAGDTVTFSDEAQSLAQSMTPASNAALASNVALVGNAAGAGNAAVASNAGTDLGAHGLGLGVSDGSGGSGASKDLESLKDMIENIKEQISTVKQSGESKKEKEAKLVNLRDELARAQREYQKAVLDGVAGIPRVQGTRAEGMGSSLT